MMTVPVIPLGVAGYSGVPVKPMALRIVWQVARAVPVPIVGVGGIATAEDVLEFLAAGAAAVQVGTANLVRPDAMAGILADLERLLVDAGTTVADLSRALVRGEG